jgi:hypothetical protein
MGVVPRAEGSSPDDAGRLPRGGRWFSAPDRRELRTSRERRVVALLLIVLLLILILGGLGLAVLKLLFWIALIMLVLWVIGFFVRGAEGARWYRW